MPITTHYPYKKIALAGLLLLAFSFALWLYVTTAVPGLIVRTGIEAEAAQLQRAANRLGIAHSTGYPIFTMLGYAAARLGDALGQSPYTWVTYLSSFLGAISVILFLLLTLRLSNPFAAAAATFLFTVSNTIWYAATITETQTLHAICLIGILLLIVIHIQQPERFYPLIGMVLLAGIGLANHRTIVLIFPSAVIAILSTLKWWVPPLRRWLMGIAGAALVTGTIAFVLLKLRDFSGTEARTWTALVFASVMTVGMLLVWAWQRLTFRQVILLLVLLVLPVLSYGYMFIRATDPHVAYSTRKTQVPAELSNEDVVSIIRGDLQNGQSASVNFQQPKTNQEFEERFNYVLNNFKTELPMTAIIAGLLGLALLAWQNWRYGVVFGVYIVIWWYFLMAWRLEKAVIYQHALTAPFVLGIAVLASWSLTHIGKAVPNILRSPLALGIFSLPIVALAANLYLQNRPERNISDDHTGDDYYEQMATLPHGTIVMTGGWSAETFILLEFIDNEGRNDLEILGEIWHWMLIEEANDLNQTVYISPFIRAIYYSDTWDDYFRQNMALSGTDSPMFFQSRPKNDPRLLEEANQAEVVNFEVTPEIELYSYDLNPTETGLALTLYWRADTATSIHYSVYNHIREYAGDGTLLRLIAQDDSYSPVEGFYPTWRWIPGEIVKDTYLIPWQSLESLPEGSRLVIGMTRAPEGTRMNELEIPLLGQAGVFSSLR